MSQQNCLKRLKNRIFSIVLISSILTFLLSFLLSGTIYAQTAGTVSLQGKIVRNDAGYEGLNVVNGTPSCVTSGTDDCNFKVSYYSASTSGTLYYSESFADVEIGDYGGVFNLNLGSGTLVSGGSETSFAEVVGKYKDVYIEIAFDPAGATTYGEVFTRTPLAASAYAMGAGADGFSFYSVGDAEEGNLAEVEGAVYYNTDDNELKMFDGSSWISLSTGGGSWGTSNVSGFATHDGYMSDTGIGLFSNFSLDSASDRVSVNTDQMRGGLSVYSSYDTSGGTWPLVSFKADDTSFSAAILELTQDGTGNLLEMNVGSNELVSIFDNNGYLRSYAIHLNDPDLSSPGDGVLYIDPFDGSLPGGGDLNPYGSEGCVYSYGGNLYWDASCDASSPIALGAGSSSLWTDGGTFTYLDSTTDDLVLGASTTTNPPFFFDVSEKRLGIGTSTPQAAIDIAGASSSISNTTGDITINPADQLVILGDVELGDGSTSRSLYAYNAARTYYGQLELYNLATGDLSLTTTFPTGDIVLNTGGDVIFTGGGLNLSDNWSNVFGENLRIWGNNNSDIYLQPDAGMGYVGIGNSDPQEKLHLTGGTLLVDQPGNPTLEGSYVTGYSYNVDVVGQYAYVAGWSNLRIIDISDPGNPSLEGSYSTGDRGYDIEVAGRYAYLADGSSGLKVLDISNPSSPSLIGTYSSVSSAQKIFILGKYLYLVDYGFGLKIIDISDPTNLLLVGSYSISVGYGADIYVIDRYAYFSTSGNGFRILDVSDPSNPSLVTTYWPSYSARGIYISGKYAYLSAGDAGLDIVDISNPSSLSSVGSYNTTGSARSVSVAGKYAYVADGTAGFHIIDISDPSNLTLEGTYSTGATVIGEDVSGKYAYIVDTSSGLYILDIGGVDVSTARIGNIEANSIGISENLNVGNHLYVRGGLNVGFGGVFAEGPSSFSGLLSLRGDFEIGDAGDSGSVRYNTGNDELEFSNDGTNWISLANATKSVTLSSEYAGAVLAADGSNNTGFMTSDGEIDYHDDYMNYYEWNSSETTLQDYDVRVRFTIPSDFASWGTNAFTLNFATEAAASTNNMVDIYVYEESAETVDDSNINQYSSSAGVWQTANIQGADLGDCNAAGETCLILIRMYSANDNYVRIGDIDVNYTRKL
jgi:hypothetical protein